MKLNKIDINIIKNILLFIACILVLNTGAALADPEPDFDDRFSNLSLANWDIVTGAWSATTAEASSSVSANYWSYSWGAWTTDRNNLITHQISGSEQYWSFMFRYTSTCTSDSCGSQSSLKYHFKLNGTTSQGIDVTNGLVSFFNTSTSSTVQTEYGKNYTVSAYESTTTYEGTVYNQDGSIVGTFSANKGTMPTGSLKLGLSVQVRAYHGTAYVTGYFDNVMATVDNPALPEQTDIYWSNPNYEFGVTSSLNVNLVNPSLDSYLYYSQIIRPSGTLHSEYTHLTGTTAFLLPVDELGMWTARLYKKNYATNEITLLDTGTTAVYSANTETWVYFTDNNYDVDEVARINYSLKEPWTDQFLYNYYLELYEQNSNTMIYRTYIPEGINHLDYKLSSPGLYTAKIKRKSYLYEWDVMDEALAASYANVIDMHLYPSYLIMNTSAKTNNPFSIGYHLGYSTGNADQDHAIEIHYLNGNTYELVKDYYFSSNYPDGNQTFFVTNIGTYLVKLLDKSRSGFLLDSRVLTVYEGSIIPQYNFVSSYINTTYSTYSQGASITGVYRVQREFYENSTIKIHYYDADRNYSYFWHTAPEETGTFNDYVPEMGIGNQTVNLTAINATGVIFELANKTFTVNQINGQGFGLVINKKRVQTGETFSVQSICPEPCTLVLQNNYTVVSNWSFNQSYELMTKIMTAGNYAYYLYATSNLADIQQTRAIDVYEIVAPTPTPEPLPGIIGGNGGGEPADKMDDLLPIIGMGDGWEAKLIFALLGIGIMLVVVYTGTKSQFISLVAGIFTFLWFLVIEYIPFWVVVFLVIAMLLKSKVAK